LQDLADHGEVGAVAGILPLEIGEIGVGDVEPLRQQLRNQQYHRGLVAQKYRSVAKFVDD